MCRILAFLWHLQPQDFFVSPGYTHFSWNEHLAYSKRNGKDLRDRLTSRFASSMVVVALFINVELALLFSPSDVGTGVRDAMRENRGGTASAFSILLIISIFFAILCIIATFGAWTALSAVSDENVHLLLRCTVGRYVVQLPKTLLLFSMYTFLAWLCMALFLLLPDHWAGPILCISVAILLLTIVMNSLFERMVMDSGAMGEKRILNTKDVDTFKHPELDEVILERARENRQNRVSARSYYPAMYKEEMGDQTFSMED